MYVNPWDFLSLWQFLGSVRVSLVILFSCTVEFSRRFGRSCFFTKTHTGSGTGSVMFFDTSQGGCHPQLEPDVITSKFHNVGRVSHFLWVSKLGWSTKYSGRSTKVPSSRLGVPQSTFPWPWDAAEVYSINERRIRNLRSSSPNSIDLAPHMLFDRQRIGSQETNRFLMGRHVIARLSPDRPI